MTDPALELTLVEAPPPLVRWLVRLHGRDLGTVEVSGNAFGGWAARALDGTLAAPRCRTKADAIAALREGAQPDVLVTTMLRDRNQRAHLVLVSETPAGGPAAFCVAVSLHGTVWTVECGHLHRSQIAARRCLPRMAAKWERYRNADAIVMVNGGRTVEWRWASATAPTVDVQRGVGVSFSRANPAVDDVWFTHTVVADLGSYLDYLPRRRRTT